MSTVAYTNDTDTRRMPRTRRISKVSVSQTAEVDNTPESELITVEEYFGILRKRVNDYYDNL